MSTMEQDKEFKHLVRVANTDLDGNIQVHYALRKIKGVDYMFSQAACHIAHIPKEKKTGSLTNEEIQQIDAILKNPAQFHIPAWMFNRRRDVETGKDMHLIMSDLKFAQENDIRMMKKMKSYKGIRHILGLPVRGQRTRSNFRKNKGKVHLGVKRSAGVKPGKV